MVMTITSTTLMYGNDRPAMFVFNTSETRDYCSSCYKDDFPPEFTDLQKNDFWMKKSFKYIKDIYKEIGRKNKILQDLFYPGDTSEVEKWIEDPNGKDVLARLETMDGFTHDVIVVFQEENPRKFEHNVCMRCTAILIVVTIPPTPHSNFCFCGICSNCQKLTCEMCTKCMKPGLYFCSKSCRNKKARAHKQECHKRKKDSLISLFQQCETAVTEANLSI